LFAWWESRKPLFDLPRPRFLAQGNVDAQDTVLVVRLRFRRIQLARKLQRATEFSAPTLVAVNRSRCILRSALAGDRQALPPGLDGNVLGSEPGDFDADDAAVASLEDVHRRKRSPSDGARREPAERMPDGLLQLVLDQKGIFQMSGIDPRRFRTMCHSCGCCDPTVGIDI